MMWYPPADYIIFRLRNFKFYGSRGSGAGDWITQLPQKIALTRLNL